MGFPLRDMMKVPRRTEKGARPSQSRSYLKSSRLWFPIKAKIALPYLFLALVLAFGAAFVITRIIFDTIEERFTNHLIETGKLTSEHMVREEARLLETFRLLAYTEGVPDTVRANDAESLRTMTFGILVNNQIEAVDF